jgi:hypothetical protein
MSVLNLYLSFLLLSSLTRFSSFTPIFWQKLVTFHLIMINLLTQSFCLIFNLLLMMRFLNSCLSLLPLTVTLTLYLFHSSSNVLLFSFLLSQISSIYHYLLGSFLINSKAVRSIHSSKKPNLNREDLGNYRPVSHLSFLFKLTERIAKNRLMNHLSSNKLLNSFQSAYLKSHSTETTLLSVHDHIVRAMSLQQVSCLCLLDLSAAFDTTDHSILIHRLSSWFGISGCALSSVKSYLSNRSFYVNLTGTKSSVFQLLYRVPQGSVLGPLFFILYTTPLSHIISKSASNHHLYADDTQLYMSFPATDFSYNIAHLEDPIVSICNWMSANFLTQSC